LKQTGCTLDPHPRGHEDVPYTYAASTTIEQYRACLVHRWSRRGVAEAAKKCATPATDSPQFACASRRATGAKRHGKILWRPKVGEEPNNCLGWCGGRPNTPIVQAFVYVFFSFLKGSVYVFVPRSYNSIKHKGFQDHGLVEDLQRKPVDRRKGDDDPCKQSADAAVSSHHSSAACPALD
jgi:hypothetical protein